MKAHWPLFSIGSAVYLFLAGLVFFLINPSLKDHSDFLSYQVKAANNQESRRFDSVESESEYRLTYHWENFENRELSISFSVSKDVLKESDDEFGYYPDELDKYIFDFLVPLRHEMIVHLKTYTQKLIRKSKYSAHFTIEEDGQDRFNLKLSAMPSNYDEVKKEFERITRAMAKEQAKFFSKIDKATSEAKKEFLQARGLIYVGTKIGINYGQIARNNRSRVEEVFYTLQKISEDLNIHQFISLLLSFIQEIRYGIPPLSENGKYILGFWVPLKVLAINFGDCDCKGVTFASFWLSYKRYPLLLIKIPNHMFLGLAIPSFGGEGLVINGMRYTLCEVTGPDKIPMGIITPYSRLHFDGGNYTYDLIK